MKPYARAGALLLVALFLLATAALGIRPWLPRFHALAFGTNVGAYNMFSARIRSREVVELRRADGRRLRIPHSRYLWKNNFISTTHSYLDRSVLDRFALFLASRPEVRRLVPIGDHPNWTVVVTVTYTRTGSGTSTLTASSPLGPG